MRRRLARALVLCHVHRARRLHRGQRLRADGAPLAAKPKTLSPCPSVLPPPPASAPRRRRRGSAVCPESSTATSSAAATEATEATAAAAAPPPPSTWPMPPKLGAGAGAVAAGPSSSPGCEYSAVCWCSCWNAHPAPFSHFFLRRPPPPRPRDEPPPPREVPARPPPPPRGAAEPEPRPREPPAPALPPGPPVARPPVARPPVARPPPPPPLPPPPRPRPPPRLLPPPLPPPPVSASSSSLSSEMGSNIPPWPTPEEPAPAAALSSASVRGLPQQPERSAHEKACGHRASDGFGQPQNLFPSLAPDLTVHSVFLLPQSHSGASPGIPPHAQSAVHPPPSFFRQPHDAVAQQRPCTLGLQPQPTRGGLAVVVRVPPPMVRVAMLGWCFVQPVRKPSLVGRGDESRRPRWARARRHLAPREHSLLKMKLARPL